MNISYTVYKVWYFCSLVIISVNVHVHLAFHVHRSYVLLTICR